MANSNDSNSNESNVETTTVTATTSKKLSRDQLAYKPVNMRGRHKETKERRELRKFIRRKTIKYVDLNRSLTHQGSIISAIQKAINRRFPHSKYTIDDTVGDVSRQRRALRETRGLVKHRKQESAMAQLISNSKNGVVSTASKVLKKKWASPQPLRVRVEPMLLKAVSPPSHWDVDLVVEQSLVAASGKSKPTPFNWEPDPVEAWIVDKNIA